METFNGGSDRHRQPGVHTVTWRKAVGPIVAILIIAGIVGLVWSQGWWGGGNGGNNGPPAVSPVTATLSCVRTAPGGPWRATLTAVSSEEPFPSYEVTLNEVPTDTKIVDRERVKVGRIAGTDNVSLSYEDTDTDTRMTQWDVFMVESVGPGPYDFTLIWEENGATVTTVRCS